MSSAKCLLWRQTLMTSEEEKHDFIKSDEDTFRVR